MCNYIVEYTHQLLLFVDVNRLVTASSSQCYSDAITDHTVDVVWLTPLTGLEMQKVCDIGCKFNLSMPSFTPACRYKGCFEL